MITMLAYPNFDPSAGVDKVVLIGLSISKRETSAVLNAGFGVTPCAESDDLCQASGVSYV